MMNNKLFPQYRTIKSLAFRKAEFYQDLESYGWDRYKDLSLPEAPQKRYYSKMIVRQQAGNGYSVEDLDVPTSRTNKIVNWRPSDSLTKAMTYYLLFTARQ